MQRRQWLTLAPALAALPTLSFAQTPPARMMVGATPGGGTDIVARALANAMEKDLGRSIVVENKPGAGGNIASGIVANARGDAGALLLAYTSHAINPSLMGKARFDAEADFTPISLIATSPLLLVGRPDLPANNLPELVAYAKAHPGKLSLAAAGLGSASQLAGEMMKHKTGMNLISVPYKGAPPALVDILGGQGDMLLSSVSNLRPLLASGKLKALAISTLRASDEYPGVRPISDLLPDFDFVAWYGLLAPAGLDDAAVARLEAAARKSLGSADVQKRLDQDGLSPVGSSAAQFKDFLRAEIRRWAEVVRVTGTKVS